MKKIMKILHLGVNCSSCWEGTSVLMFDNEPNTMNKPSVMEF